MGLSQNIWNIKNKTWYERLKPHLMNFNLKMSVKINVFDKIVLSNLRINIDDKRIKPRIRIDHDDYVMSLACLTALRSPDPNTKVGACIVNKDKRIVGLGFNDFPKRHDSNVNNGYELPFDREDEKSMLGTKYPYVCHAAENVEKDFMEKTYSLCLSKCFIPKN